MYCSKKGITVWLRNIEFCTNTDEVVHNIFVAIRSSPMDWTAATDTVSAIDIGSQLDQSLAQLQVVIISSNMKQAAQWCL
ncbi:hypothetical protein GCM10007107_38670 [Shewanella indica]|nr:hypothetical protein GCM10007107_38670 [Shewanella indica]